MKTINYFVAFAIGIMLASCSTTYTAGFYQIAQTKAISSSNTKVVEDRYTYEDENCKVSYDLWANGGYATITVQNLTNDILYFNLDESFWVVNGISKHKNIYLLMLHESTIKTDDKVSYIMDITPSMAIAPKASTVLVSIPMHYTQQMDCDLNIIPKANEPAALFFDEGTTPTTVRSILTYRVNDNSSKHFIETAFYISSIVNYRKTDIVKTITDMNRHTCFNMNGDGTAYTYNQNQYLFSPATGFYIYYTHTVTE